MPSTNTAPPGPISAVRPEVRSAPNGSIPTNAAAQIASARARISSVLIACTTTVDNPTKRTPANPPTNASASDSHAFVEAPMPARAAPVTTNPTRSGSPLFGRPARRKSAVAPRHGRGEHRLKGREAERPEDAAEHRQDAEQPDRQSPGLPRDGERHRQGHVQGLEDEQQLAPVVAVGERSRGQGEDQVRDR